ncbi:MAG: ketopantoate reductase family protein [Oscillospiraceae bacterium]|nr:ketopantoate reductase family protein [Oscillospiraceae bacterium]MBQ9696111.1 ketopantoate reductase family protein [Oscillospiraceae bacterium]
MHILVYGCGVIGSYLVHVLCKAGNDVTVVSKGTWGEVLAAQGLHIRHPLQHKDTVDHPRIARELPEERFDAVFSVMQGCQQRAVLPELARANAPLVILVGNNPKAAETERELLSLTEVPKTVLFGFQGTAGVRAPRYVNCLHAGNGSMTVGGLHRALTAAEERMLTEMFSGSGYGLHPEDDMEGWLYCHAAFVLPIVYESYRYDCDLRDAPVQDLDRMLTAVEEAYGLIEAAGIPIRPRGDEDYFRSKPKMAAMRAMMYVVARTKLGELCATDHCRNAVTEMEWLDAAFEALRAAHPDCKMPAWSAMRRSMPSWEQIHSVYDNAPRTQAPPGSGTEKKILAALAVAGTAALLVHTIRTHQKGETRWLTKH